MRDRKVIAVYILGALAIVGGIVLYANLSHDAPESQAGGSSERVSKGQGILIDLSIPESPVERQEADASGPVRRTAEAPALQTSMSSARGSATAPSPRPAVVSAPAPCAPSLLGSVIGLLGALLGGGGC